MSNAADTGGAAGVAVVTEIECEIVDVRPAAVETVRKTEYVPPEL
jgi:hypothetical protein